MPVHLEKDSFASFSLSLSLRLSPLPFLLFASLPSSLSSSSRTHTRVCLVPT